MTQVVILRTRSGEDVIGFLDQEQDGVVQVSHPHVTYIDPASSTLYMYPYCTLSSVIQYKFRSDDLLFVVEARSDVSLKFIQLLASADVASTPDRALH